MGYTTSYTNSPFKNLPYASTDAQKIGKFLTENELYTSQTPIFRLNENATRDIFIYELDKLRQNENYKSIKRLVLYFAGHGYIDDTDNEVYLLGDNTSHSCPTCGLSLTSILKKVQWFTKQGIEVLLILDACHSGEALFTENWNQKNNKGQLIAFTASGPLEKAFEGAQWGEGQGVFTFALLEGMEGTASNGEDDLISVRELGRFVQDKVESETHNQQQPKFSARDERKTFISKFDSKSKKHTLNLVPVSHSITPQVRQKNSSGNENKELENNIKRLKGDTLNPDLPYLDTIGLIRDVESFRNQVIDDPFTLPNLNTISTIKNQVEKLIDLNLTGFEFYSQYENDIKLLAALELLAIAHFDYMPKLKELKKEWYSSSTSSVVWMEQTEKQMDKLLTKYERIIAKAIFILDGLIRKEKNNPSHYMLKAIGYKNIKRYDKAIEIVEQAIKTNSNYPFFYLIKALILTETGLRSESEDNLKIFQTKISLLEEFFLFSSIENSKSFLEFQKLIKQIEKHNLRKFSISFGYNEPMNNLLCMDDDPYTGWGTMYFDSICTTQLRRPVECDSVTFIGGPEKITIQNLTSLGSEISIIGNSTKWDYNSVCNQDCIDSIEISNLSKGTYYVKLQMFGIDNSYCYLQEEVEVFSEESFLAQKDSFSVSLELDYIKLLWINNKLKSIKKVIVERQGNGNIFNPIAEVNANNGVISFKDNNPIEGDNIYRLKFRAANDKFIFSPTKSILFTPSKILSESPKTSNSLDFNILTNTITPDFSALINLKNYVGRDIEINVYDILGKKIFSKKIKVQSPNYYIPSNIFEKGSNVGLIELKENNRPSIVKKFLILKVE